jgi:hypothetical protein
MTIYTLTNQGSGLYSYNDNGTLYEFKLNPDYHYKINGVVAGELIDTNEEINGDKKWALSAHSGFYYTNFSGNLEYDGTFPLVANTPLLEGVSIDSTFDYTDTITNVTKTLADAFNLVSTATIEWQKDGINVTGNVLDVPESVKTAIATAAAALVNFANITSTAITTDTLTVNDSMTANSIEVTEGITASTGGFNELTVKNSQGHPIKFNIGELV